MIQFFYFDDTVRIVNCDHHTGSVGKIIDTNYDAFHYQVEFPDGPAWWFDESELEQVCSICKSGSRGLYNGRCWSCIKNIARRTFTLWLLINDRGDTEDVIDVLLKSVELTLTEE